MIFAIQNLIKNFNPRPREEGDIYCCIYILKRCYFNPRPREEGDQGAFDFPSKKKDFNPRPREEGDMAIKHCMIILNPFQSTPS